MPSITDKCYQKSIDILKKASTPHGFVASSHFGHYYSIWTRDSSVSILGAVLTGDVDLLATSRNNLKTLQERQAESGAIIDVYWPKEKYWDWGENGATDASAWFIVASYAYWQATNDKEFVREIWPAVKKALVWLSYQDANNFGLVDSPEASEWMDSSYHRAGKVFYNNCLFYKAALDANSLAKVLGEKPVLDPKQIKTKLNLLFWPDKSNDISDILSHVSYPKDASVDFRHSTTKKAFKRASINRKYYISHFTWGRFVDICDVLANSFAILWDVADGAKTKKIINHFARKKVAQPYPVRTIDDPSSEENDPWGFLKMKSEENQKKRWRNSPYHYHNGGIWPFVGGFYVASLAKAGQKNNAERALEKLAQANLDGKFNEWHHGISGKPMGAKFQAWNAGAYIVAYKAVKK